MTKNGSLHRRQLLQGGAGLLTGAMTPALTASSVAAEPVSPAPRAAGNGKGVGDFDFLTGEWTIRNRRLKDGTKDVWEEFDGAATVHGVLGGQASIEELRAKGKYLGMGVRVWHVEEKKWADHWTGVYNGVVNPPQMGEFVNGEGIFLSEEEVDGVTWIYRGVWDRITQASCRWHQSSSTDGGKTWDWNWYMDWTRVS